MDGFKFFAPRNGFIFAKKSELFLSVSIANNRPIDLTIKEAKIQQKISKKNSSLSYMIENIYGNSYM